MLSSGENRSISVDDCKRHLQVAALCYRFRKKELEVLLVRSLGQGRWILPKGWPMKHKPNCIAALTEAFEEAGVYGDVSSKPVGQFLYEKQRRKIACVAQAYPVRVKRLKKRFPEADCRERLWADRKSAAKMVAEPSLRKLIKGFEPQP